MKRYTSRMPLYSYSALNEKGARMHGTIDADSIDEARDAIKKQGLTPEEVFQISYDSSQSTSFDAIPAPEPEPIIEPTPEINVDIEPPAPPSEQEVEEPIVEPNRAAQEAAASNWKLEEDDDNEIINTKQSKTYYPMLDTLRLYAGWLLAWYAIVYALGYYQSTRNLSFEVPYLMGIYTSPLVLSFTLASFLFLLMTSLHKRFGRGMFSGISITILGLVIFVLYRMNV